MSAAITPTFAGEVMMAGWSDTHTSGAKITFWLPDAESLEVFKGLTQKKGNTAGHRFMCVLVEIGCDEKPVQADMGNHITEFVEPETQSTLHKTPIGPLCLLAVRWCVDPDFLRWSKTSSAGEAKQFILDACEIDSRKKLDEDDAAKGKFHLFIRGPFSKYLIARGFIR